MGRSPLRISTASEARAGPGVDLTPELVEAVGAAAAQGRALRILGGGTRAFYGRRVTAEPLDVSGHRGVVDYDPTELVVTARAGTPILEIEALLAEHGQMLAFEPPVFGRASTLGGTVAAGLSGPRRPFAGALRDAVLGVTVLDGRGERLRLGGVVFKNVAGFDGFRLMAGALGCLGVLLDVSLRVAPRPRRETAISLPVGPEAAARTMLDLMRLPTPLSGAAYDGERLRVRLSGGEQGVAAAQARVGGEPDALEFWQDLRHLTLPFFDQPGSLWRLSVPATAPPLAVDGRWLIDWGGAQRWLVTEAPAEAVRRAAQEAGGHATLLRGDSPDGEVFTPLPAPLLALHRRLKAAFDPAGVFNPGRMYADL